MDTVSSDCHNRITETEIYHSQFWRLDVSGQGPARLVSGEDSLPGLYMAAFLLCPYLTFPQCLCVSVSGDRESERVHTHEGD